MKISLWSDHAGFSHKESIKIYLESIGYTIRDHGAHSIDSMDYPDSAHPVCDDVVTGISDYGILLCGTANGMAITANKYPTIRAWLAWNGDIASLVRAHNDVNILCVPARYTTVDEAIQIVQVFLSTEFEWGRHAWRIAKIVP
jgi:ribose 5-phosphate isomerase B